MTIPRTLSDNGSPITGYKLLVDLGDDFSSTFTEVASYDSELTYTVTVITDSLVTSKVYRFVTVATNAYGDSEYSLQMIAGLGAKPPAPSTPIRDTTTYLEEAMVLTWGEVTGSDLLILGYKLLMDDGFGGPFSVVYDGATNP